MLRGDALRPSSDLGDDFVLYKRALPSHGPIGPPSLKSSLTPSSREFVPSSLLFPLKNDNLRPTQRDLPAPLPQPIKLTPLSRNHHDRERELELETMFEKLASLSIQTATSNNGAYSSSITTPQLTYSATASSPRTSDSETESPTKLIPAPNFISRGLTAADLSADLLSPPSKLDQDDKYDRYQAISPTDSDDMPVMRGGETPFPIRFPSGPAPWNAAPMNFTPAPPRYPAATPMPAVAPGYPSLIAIPDVAVYHAAPPAYSMPYSSYAPPLPAPYGGTPAPAMPLPAAYGPPQASAASPMNEPWIRDAMIHFQYMGRDGPRDTEEDIDAALQFLINIHENNHLATYNTEPGAPWRRQLISPQHGAYMARAALPQLRRSGAAHVIRSGIHRLPMPQMLTELEFGVAPNNKKKDLYKTELCRNWEERGECRYGEKCQFAHGRDELRNIPRHPKYKTEFCRTWYTEGSCPYAGRCCFIHPTDSETAALAGRILPGPGGEPIFPRPPASANRGQSLLDRIRNSSSGNDNSVDHYASSQVTTSPVATRVTSPGGQSSSSAGASFANIGLPRVASAGNISALVEDTILGRHRLSKQVPSPGSVVSLGHHQDDSRVSMTAPPSPSPTNSSLCTDSPVVPPPLIKMSQATLASSNVSQTGSGTPNLNLRLNTSFTSADGPQTAPVSRASMSTASMFGPTSPTLRRNDRPYAPALSPPISAHVTTSQSFRPPTYATLSDLRGTVPTRPALMQSHGRMTSYNDSSAGAPAPRVSNTPPASGMPYGQLSASANGRVQNFDVPDMRWL